MGKHKTHDQQALFIPAAKLPQSLAHPFYVKLNEVLAGWKFDSFVEVLCAKFYEEKIGRLDDASGPADELEESNDRKMGCDVALPLCMRFKNVVRIIR